MKKLTKVLAMLLALTMLLALCACGSAKEETAAATTEAATTTETATATETAPASEAATAEQAAPAETEVEPLTFHIVTTQYETNPSGMCVKHFAEKVSELSGGKITCTVAYGGSEYDNAGQFEAASNGAVDMFWMLGIYSQYLPSFCWGISPPAETAEQAMEIANYMLVENEESAAIINSEFDANNLVRLSNAYSGYTSFVTTFDWDTLSDFATKCTAFGTMNSAKFGAIGLTCTAVRGPECYDALSRGICDGVASSFLDAYTNCLYEVADYVTFDGTQNSVSGLVANKDWWNGLTDGQRAIISEACAENEQYSIENCIEQTEAAKTAWKEATGTDPKCLTGDTLDEYYSIVFNQAANNACTALDGDARQEGLIRVIEIYAEKVGVTWEKNF